MKTAQQADDKEGHHLSDEFALSPFDKQSAKSHRYGSADNKPLRVKNHRPT